MKKNLAINADLHKDVCGFLNEALDFPYRSIREGIIAVWSGSGKGYDIYVDNFHWCLKVAIKRDFISAVYPSKYPSLCVISQKLAGKEFTTLEEVEEFVKTFLWTLEENRKRYESFETLPTMVEGSLQTVMCPWNKALFNMPS